MKRDYSCGAINEGLTKIMEYRQYCPQDSMYYAHYEELLNDCGNLAADQLDNLFRVIEQIGNRFIGVKTTWDGRTGGRWFNAIASTIYDIDAEGLNEDDDIYDYDECERAQAERANTVKRLSKDNLMWIYPLVFDVINDYVTLQKTYDILFFAIQELEYHQSAVKSGGEVQLADAAYL